MARTSFPRDRFDDLAPQTGRVGAHRAENPRMRAGVVFLWAAATTVVLIVAGIFGTLVISGRISFAPPEALPTTTPVPEVEPVVDTSYPVLVLNATGQQGLATQVRDDIITAGWPADIVSASSAETTDFPVTTIYYASAADEAAALGLAQTIGGAEIAESTQYLPPDDPDTEENESGKQLTVVLGLDRIQPAAEDPAP